MKKSERRLPAEIEGLRVDFAGWRKRKRGRERIPEDLWSSAVGAAERYGVYRVCREVGLEYRALQRRVKERERAVGGRHVEFVELKDKRAEQRGGCVVELEKGNGTRMRISVGDAGSVDWYRLKEAFLGG